MKMRVIGGFNTVNFYCLVWSRYYEVKMPPDNMFYDLPDGVSIFEKWVIVKKRGRP